MTTMEASFELYIGSDSDIKEFVLFTVSKP